MSIRSIATAFIILLLAITFACVNDCWTKSSIEDLSIKEVRSKTIGKPLININEIALNASRTQET